jgi:hypothetical protein
MVAAFAVALVVPTVLVPTADAAIVPTVPLATAAEYSVLAATTVTNTGPSVLAGSLGVSPGSAVVGFPPGIVLPPSTVQAASGPAATAQANLTIAYNNAAGRPLDAEVPADLAGQTLQGGVYAATANGPLGLTGTVTLDGAGDPSSVFIFQTGSTLITGSGSTVALINGAQECNVFWQVGSSATLGTSSTFRGNILALTSVTVQTGATVAGRALARNGAVTLDTNVFTLPSCDLTVPTTAAPTTAAPSSTAGGPTTVAPSTTAGGPTTVAPSTTAGGPTTVAPSTTAGGPTTVAPSTTAAPSTTQAGAATTLPGASTSTTAATDGFVSTVPVPAAPGESFVGRLGAPTSVASTGTRGRTTRSGGTVELPATGAGLLVGSLALAGASLGMGAVALRARRRPTR